MPLDETALDSIVLLYGDGAAAMLVRLLGMARWLYVSLAVIDLAWDLSRWSLSNSGRVMEQLLIKLLLIGIGWTLLIGSPYWLPELIEGFGVVAREATGIETLSPSALLAQGISLTTRLEDFWDVLLSALFPASAGWWRFLLSGILFASFVAAALQLAFVLVEIAVALGGFGWVLAFAGWSRSWPIASNYLTYLVFLGIKTVAVAILVQIGGDLAAIWDEQLSEIGRIGVYYSPRVLMSLVVSAAAWALLVVVLPGSIARRLTSNLDFAPERIRYDST